MVTTNILRQGRIMSQLAQLRTVSEVAQEIGCRPRDISDAIYSRRVDTADCPIVGGRRLIPSSMIAEFRRILRDEANCSHRDVPDVA